MRSAQSETQAQVALDNFVQRYIDYARNEQPLWVDYDPQWLSPCLSEHGEAGQKVAWQPVRQSEPVDFGDSEQALEMVFHPDVKTFYGRYWSEGLNAQTDRGPLQLLQLWNDDDAVLLQQNLIGHVLMKRRLQQPETLFLAVTDDDDLMISLDNTTGAVMLEQVGMVPHETLAPNLADFLASLRPGPPF